jgi:hypothetical protein
MRRGGQRVLQLSGATMSANQPHRFLSRPLAAAIRTGCALVAAGQLMGVSVEAMPRPDAAPGKRALHRPLAFEPNHGQADGEVRFLARGAGYTAFFTPSEMVLLLDDGGPCAIVRLKPIGANTAARLLGDGELPGVVNDFRDAPSAARAALRHTAA